MEECVVKMVKGWDRRLCPPFLSSQKESHDGGVMAHSPCYWVTSLMLEKSDTTAAKKRLQGNDLSVLGPFLPQWNMFFWDFWLISRAVLSKAEKTEVFARVGSCDSESRWTLVLRLRQGNVGYYNYFSRFELFLGLLANSLHLFLTLLSSDKHYRTPQLQKNIHFFQSFCNNIICLNDL